MDEDVLVQELVNRLTFEVEPCETDEVTPPNRNATPLNVKVRVRNKNEPKLIQRGIPQGTQATIPERLQLIGSNKTVISFNVFMEPTTSKGISPKSHKRGFHFFKLGGCLGTSYDEDGGPYLPGSSNKDALQTNRSSKSASLITDELEDLPDKRKFNSMPRNQKKLFGKCKPGGCLDPPFDEDKYPYSLPKVSPRTNQPLKEIEDKKEKKNAENFEPVKPSKEFNESAKVITKNEDESKPVLNIYPRHENYHPLTSNYFNSIITYPPGQTLSQTNNNEQGIEKKNKIRSFDSGAARPSYEYSQTYFIPPKEFLKQKEEERRYSRELSNDKIKYDDDERNKDKNGFSKYTKITDIHNERNRQESMKQSSSTNSRDIEKNQQIEAEMPDNSNPLKTTRRFGEVKDALDNPKPMPYETDLSKNTRRVAGNEDDCDSSNPIADDTDTIKYTPRFTENKDDFDSSSPIAHDIDTMKNMHRVTGNEDDFDSSNPIADDTDTIKYTRRFTENKDDFDSSNPIAHDIDTMKNAHRVAGNEDDFHSSNSIADDTDTIKNVRRFTGNKDYFDSSNPIADDIDTMKNTRRFTENKDDFDSSSPIAHDIDTMKNMHRVTGNEDDFDSSNPIADDTDTIKYTRRFTENKDDFDSSNPIAHDIDTMKNAHRVAGNEDDFHSSNSIAGDTDTIKNVRRFTGNKDYFDSSNPIADDIDTMKNTRRFAGNEDDFDSSNPMSHDTDTMKNTHGIGGIQEDIDNSKSMPYDTDGMKNTHQFRENEEDVDNSNPMPYDSDLSKNTHRFGGHKEDIQSSKPMPYGADLSKSERRFGENEENIDNSKPVPYDTDLSKNTRRFEGSEEDKENSKGKPYEQADYVDYDNFNNANDMLEKSQVTKEKEAGVLRNSKYFDNQSNRQDMQIDTNVFFSRDHLSSKSVSSENKEFATSSIDSIHSNEHLFNNKLKDDILNTTKDFYSEKVSPPWNVDSIQNEGNSSAILHKTPFVATDGSIHYDEISKSNPVRRNTFTIIDSSRTSLQKQIEEIASQRIVIENDIESVLIEAITGKTIESVLRIMSSDTEVNTPQDSRSNSPTYTHENNKNKEDNALHNNNINTERARLNDVKRNVIENGNEPVLIEDIGKTIESGLRIMSSDTEASIPQDSRSNSPTYAHDNNKNKEDNALHNNNINTERARLNEVQRRVIENGKKPVLIEAITGKTIESGLKIISSDTEVNTPQNLRSNSHTHDNIKNKEDNVLLNNNINTERARLYEVKDVFDIPMSANSISTKKSNYINSDTQLTSLKQHDHHSVEEHNVEYDKLLPGTSADINNVPPSSSINDELTNKTISSPQSTNSSGLLKDKQSTKAKTNDGFASKAGSLIHDDATMKQNLGSCLLSPDETFLHPKVLQDPISILVNLSFQSYIDDNGKRIIQTLNPLVKPHLRHKDDTITVFQYYLHHGNEIRIPVDPEHDLVLNLFAKNPKPDDIKIDHAEENQAGTTNAGEMLKKNLTIIFESGLIPLYSVIKDLIEEINALSAQQEMLKVKVGKAKRSKSLRLIAVNNRCGCRKN